MSRKFDWCLAHYNRIAPDMKNRFLRIIIYSFVTLAACLIGGYFAFQKLTSPPAAVNPVLAGETPVVSLMDFTTAFSLKPLPTGWWRIDFFTKPPMKLSFVEKAGVKALRCETHGSGSIFGRHTDIDLAKFPTLTWSWLVDQPVIADAPEGEWSGDDHPARLLLHLRDSLLKEHYFEIIWSNGAYKPGQWKIIGDFHHYVANGGNARSGENTGRWFDEKVNVLELYHIATGRMDAPHLMSIAIFCDTDNTGTSSSAYFGKVSLEK
jgi:hypothetical protein